MRAEKKYLIAEVETHLKKSNYVILANFAKVSVADTAELRKRLDAEQAEFHVVKNSSLRVAAKALGLTRRGLYLKLKRLGLESPALPQ